jgi:hypothetical protein
MTYGGHCGYIQPLQHGIKGCMFDHMVQKTKENAFHRDIMEANSHRKRNKAKNRGKHV